jgi:hypothetical protein
MKEEVPCMGSLYRSLQNGSTMLHRSLFIEESPVGLIKRVGGKFTDLTFVNILRAKLKIDDSNSPNNKKNT